MCVELIADCSSGIKPVLLDTYVECCLTIAASYAAEVGPLNLVLKLKKVIYFEIFIDSVYNYLGLQLVKD